MKSFTKVSSAFCWPWDWSVCLIVSLASASVCWLASVMSVTREDVVAVLGLDRADELALLGGEDGVVELLVERALGLRGQLAAGGLGGVVDRVLLGDGLPGVAALERGLGLVGVGLVLGQDDAQVTLLGLREAGLVLVVEVLDRLVGDLVLALDDLVADLVRQQVELDALEDVLLGLAGRSG